MPRNKINWEDYIGLKQHNLTVLKVEKIRRDDGRTETKLLCKCDCGNKKFISASKFKQKKIINCGCKKLQESSLEFEPEVRLKTILSRMYQRCYNENNDSYENYGKVGVTICDTWNKAKDPNALENFIKWSIDNNYSNNLTIDRINGSLIYSPKTCKWSSKHEQQANRKSAGRKNSSSKYKGVTKRVSKTKTMYEARIRINYNYVALGRYPTEEEAAQVYNDYIDSNNLTEYIKNTI